MRQLRLLGLALALALAAATFGQIASAPATVLCMTEASEGFCESPYPTETTFLGTASSPNFETNLGKLSCSKSTIEGHTLEEASPQGTAMEAQVNALSFSGCTLEKMECTLTSVKTPYSSPITWTKGNNGTLKFKNGGGGTPGISITCGFLVKCTVGAEVSLEFNGGAAGKATIAAAKVKMTPGEGACFKEIFWNASYALSAPKTGEVFVQDQEALVRLCKKNETPCPAGETYPNNTPLKAEVEAPGTKVKVKITEGGTETTRNITCDSSTVEGATTALEARSLPASITVVKFDECGPTCTVTAYNLAYEGLMSATGGGSGSMTIQHGLATPDPLIQVICTGAYKCTYKGGGLTGFTITGAAPAKLVVNTSLGTKVGAESDAKCTGAALTWEGTYKFTKPENGGVPKMWVTRQGV